MLKMAILLLATLFFLCSSVAGQELLQFLTIHHQGSNPEPIRSVSPTLGIYVDEQKLGEVSTSVLMAEKWLRTHVLAHYPSINITSIVVGNGFLCDDKNLVNQEEISRLILVSMENIHHSLVRWGLERKIKASVSVTSKCLQQSYLKPVFELLEEMNSTFTMNPPDFSDETVGILSSHLKSMADLGIFRPKSVNVMFSASKQEKPTSRKLSFIDPSPEISYSVPSDAAAAPLPPLIGVTSPPPFTLPFSPATSPPPHYANLPPCNPYHGGGGAMAAPPVVGNGGATAPAPVGQEELWCVAKPSVPSEKLQEAMDYACGEGGADCDAISPTGNCYFPDSIVAHASYAFNSYWQKNKNNGGTCGFGGTAMLINSDPSFLQCHFTLG